MSDRMTYAKAGVDIDRKSDSISALVRHLGFKRKGLGKPLRLDGHFTGLIDMGDFALSLCTDGVGTKLIIADELRKWDTVGIDCIAMNVNDTICVGAEPIAFVDYIAIEKPDPEVTSQIGIGLEAGARMSNMTVVGGEVAVLPELVKGFDLAGTCLGVVDKERVVTGKAVRPGDALVGLPSSGVHSNGLTLARKIVERNGLDLRGRVKGVRGSIGAELLRPTEIYVKEVLGLLDGFDVRGMANITGGGLRNLLRLKNGVGFVVDSPMRPQPIFGALQDLGDVTDEEMYQTFNMGLGFALVVPEEQAAEIVRKAEGAQVVGRAKKGASVIVPSLGLEYIRY